MEIWKDIKYAHGYKVSNLGNIMNFNGKILKGSYTGKRFGKYRYKVHGLFVDGNRVFNLTHRIVAEHFVDNSLNLPQVNHIDKNCFNNAAVNLEWCDNKYNSRHSNKIRIKQLSMNRELIKVWDSLHDIGDFGFNKSKVSMCLNKKYNGKYLVTNHKGFIWEYE